VTPRTFTERVREQASAPLTVRRKDISLYEEDEMTFGAGAVRQCWVASLDSHLSTGEQITMSRTGATSQQALVNLEQAITDEGWSIA